MILHKTYLIFLFACGAAFAQDSIYKADGSRAAITGESVKLDFRHKQLLYANKGETGTQKIAFKDLNKVSYNGKRFQMLKVGNKSKGVFVLAQRDGLTLAALTKEITTSTGGFNQRYVNHEVMVINGAKVVERVSFTENNDDKNIKKRIKAKQMITLYFGDCVEVSERLAFFANSGNSSLIEGDLVAYLRQSPYLLCP
jgi:hypothetical protein